MLMKVLRTLAALSVVLLNGSSPDARRAPDDREPTPRRAFLGLAMDFVENRGQWDTPARFVAQRGPLSASLDRGGMTLHVAGERPATVALMFEGGSPDATLSGEEPRPGVYNFFLGNDRRRWRSNVPTFGAVRYTAVYRGVDVRVLERNGRIEYDLLLAPGADLSQVIIRTAGASDLRFDDGALVLQTPAGPLRQTPPNTWAVLPDGTTRPLESRFRRVDAERFGFEVPGWDGDLPVVIDPGLEWSTFIGGSNREEVHGLALTRDGSGDVVIAGHTWSSDFPTAPAGALGSSPLIPFVARIDATGARLVYATLFGSRNGNVSFAFDVAVDAASAPIVVGETNGADFPTTPGAFQPSFNEPSATINRGWDGFVTRFNADASEMVFSTYLGAAPIFDPSFVGSKRGGDDSARHVQVDEAGAVIVGGYTMSENFPTTAGAYDRTHATLTVPVSLNGVNGTVHSRTDAFITRFSSNGTQVTYSTYLGGQSDDIIKDMVLDARGVLTVVGTEAPIETFDGAGNRTDHGTPFPTTADAIARTHLGASDTFLARLRLDGAGAADLQYSTILGGFYIDEANGVAVDPNNPELVTLVGISRSWDFPTTPGAWRRAPAFLADGNPYYIGYMMRFRFPAGGAGSLVWSSLVTGTQTGQFADSVVVDPSGDVIVVGSDIAGTYPTTDRSYRRLPLKGSFISRFSSDGTTLLYSTLLHAPSGVLVLRIRAVSAGPRAVIVAGSTLEPDFPTTPGAYDRVFGSNGTGDGFHTFDGFVARMSLEPAPTADTTAAAPGLVSPANGAVVTLNAPLTLDWTDVADESGVQFYEVQVSANADFLPGFTFFNTANRAFTASQAAASTSQEGVHYWRVRTLDGANNFSPWSAVRRFTVGAPAWTNFAAVGLTPEAVVGGGTIVGRLHIQNTAPAGGQVYTLTSSNPSAASVPSSVTVPAGASSATFTVTTRPVSVPTPVQLTVWSEGNGDHPVLWVDPGPGGAPSASLSSLAIAPSSVAGGSSATGTVTLTAAAPSGGVAVALAEESPAVTVPASVLVPAGSTSATFAIATTTVTATTLVTVTATAAGIARTADLTVTAAEGGGGSPSGFLNPSRNQADTGGDGNGFQLNAANAHAVDGLLATDTDSGNGTSTSCTGTGKDRHRFFDYGISVPAGAAVTGIEVRLTARADSTSGTPRTCVQLSADGGATWTAAKQTPTLSATLATFTLGGAADTWGRSWTAAQLGNANFRVRVINVASSTARDFFLDGIAVRVHTGTTAPAALASVGVSPSAVTGGGSSTGTVTLTSAAPAGGAVVTLASGNSAAAGVPASVTVAAGATSVPFQVSTAAVTASTPVTITASYAGLTRTATLTVNPAAQGAALTVTATGRSGERVTSSPAGINVSVGTTGSASFATGTSITLTVSNGRDAIWSGACSSGGNKARTCTFTIGGNASVTANVQ